MGGHLWPIKRLANVEKENKNQTKYHDFCLYFYCFVLAPVLPTVNPHTGQYEVVSPAASYAISYTLSQYNHHRQFQDDIFCLIDMFFVSMFDNCDSRVLLQQMHKRLSPISYLEVE